MQLSFLKALVIVGTLAGVVLADGGYYHGYGYNHHGNGVIKRTILIDGCTGKPVSEKPAPAINNNGGGGGFVPNNNLNVPNTPNVPQRPNIPNAPNIPKTLADYGLDQYADEIEELGRQLGLENLPV